MKSAGFNPKARWDRHIPETSETPVNEYLDAVIEVNADFGGGTIYPRSFTWNNKRYEISKITYHWKERRGQEMTSYFSVACNNDLYQLSFSNTTFGWRLDKVIQ